MWKRTILLVAMCGAVAGAARPGTDVDKLAANPPATGCLVFYVIPRDPGARAGFRAGDTILAYEGKPTSTLATLNKAKAEAEAEKKETAVISVLRAGEKIEIKMPPGRIGVLAISVTKGVKAVIRPPATGVTFDFSALAKAPGEAWYLVSVDGGKTFVGFEHRILRLAEGKLTHDCEIAFHGGEGWGLNHIVSRTVVAASARPELLKTDYHNIPTGFRARGSLRRNKRRRTWQTRIREDDGRRRTVRFAATEDLFPDYLTETVLVGAAPKAGACWHFSSLNVGTGLLLGHTGLVCRGAEDVDVRGKKVRAWRYEESTAGKVDDTVWVDEAGVPVKIQYPGKVSACRATKAEALAHTPKDVTPQLDPLAEP